MKPPFEKVKLARLTNNGKIKAAAISPDSKFIAYVLGENDGNSLWVRQIDAANDIRLVPPLKSEFWELTFTPDGKQIYYNLFSSDKPDAELFRLPALGGVPQKVSNVISFAISFAPDGKRIAYILPDSKGNNNHLVTADADGANLQFIAQKPQPSTFVFDGDFAVWSPDGETIVCLVNHLEANENYSSLVAVNVKDGTEKPLGTTKWQDVSGFEWLQDGSGLIVSGREKNSAKNQIWLMSLPSGEIRPVTDDLNNYSWLSLDGNSNSMVALQTTTVNSLYVGEGNNFKEIASEVSQIYPFVWTPDGKIIFQSAADGTANLWTMDADGANRRQLTTDAQVDERGMCLTPDGKFLVFTSWRSGKSNLWRVEADGKNLTQLTFGEADAHPECTPDGESVIYQRGILSQPSLWKISVSGGEPVKLTDFRAKWGAISTDGKQISFFQMKDDKWQICLIGADGGAISNRIDVPPIQRENTIRWSPDNRNLQFIGVNGNVGNIWSLPLDGSPPKQETNFDSHWLDDFLPSPDKKKFALARRLSVSDMILISNEKSW
jgi:Tol biopolymer transport system component